MYWCKIVAKFPSVRKKQSGTNLINFLQLHKRQDMQNLFSKGQNEINIKIVGGVSRERFCSCLYVFRNCIFFRCVFAFLFKVSYHFSQFRYSNQSIKDDMDFKIFIISIFLLFFPNFQILQKDICFLNEHCTNSITHQNTFFIAK